MEFGNPIVGQEALIRSAIKSPNFVTGTTGWRIAQDGSAEFNNVVIRNGVIVSGQALYYDGTPASGNLVASIAANSGTDAFGNDFFAGITSYSSDGSYVNVTRDVAGALVYFNPPDGSTTWDPGYIRASYEDATDDRPFMSITGPKGTGELAPPFINMYGSTPSIFNTQTSFVSDELASNGPFTTYASNGFNTYTPVVGGDGSATYATLDGTWQRVGKMIFLNIYANLSAAGTGTAGLTITAPTSIDRSFRQIMPIQFVALSRATVGSFSASGHCIAGTSGSGATFEAIRANRNGATAVDEDIQGNDLLSTTAFTVQGFYIEA